MNQFRMIGNPIVNTIARRTLAKTRVLKFGGREPRSQGLDLGAKIQLYKMKTRLGGKIGVETLNWYETDFLAELMTHQSMYDLKRGYFIFNYFSYQSVIAREIVH